MSDEPVIPTIGRIVWYRGKKGLHTMRPAIVTVTVDTLDPGGVEVDPRLALTDNMHVHLHVFTPSEQGSFTEYDVPFDAGDDGTIAPGAWTWPRRRA